MAKICRLLSFALGLSAPIAAAEVPVWQLDPPAIWMVDSADAGTAADYYSYVQIMRVANTTGPMLQLSCNANSKGHAALSAAIQIDPANTYEQDPKRHLRMNTMSGKLTIGETSKAERWRYHADSTKMLPFDVTVPRRMFNGIVKNFFIYVNSRTVIYTLEVPEMNDEFKAFAKSCPVTNGGKIDPSIFEQAAEMDKSNKTTWDR